MTVDLSRTFIRPMTVLIFNLAVCQSIPENSGGGTGLGTDDRTMWQVVLAPDINT